MRVFLLHQMAHVVQFVRGRRGVHGLEFKWELLKIGIVEDARTPVLPGRTAARIAEIAQRLHPEIPGLFRTMVGRPPANQRAVEEAIFREYLSASGLASLQSPTEKPVELCCENTHPEDTPFETQPSLPQ